jgi:hypothetical protein
MPHVPAGLRIVRRMYHLGKAPRDRWCWQASGLRYNRIMLKFYGMQPPTNLYGLQVGGICPHCKTATRFALYVNVTERLLNDHSTEMIASYSCDACLRSIPIRWSIQSYNGSQPVVSAGEMVLPVREPFEFNHVPEEVEKEIREGLDCLSVGAYNGFAALCRRVIQAICTNIGAGASTKVKAQIDEMVELTGLDAAWKELALQIMFAGHDGSHPHLPDVNADRAAVLLSLVRDLTYQLYTRPGKVREAALLRREAIENQKAG